MIGTVKGTRLNTATPTASPIGKEARSLPSLVAQHIIESILSGSVQPGARLTETALADQHAVSRTTVREALAIVERAGLVLRIPRVGVQVIAIQTEELIEIAEIRGMLLALAAGRAASRSDEQLAGLRALANRMEVVAKATRSSPEEFAQLVSQAQAQLLALSGSSYLARLYEQLSQLTQWQAVVTQPGTTFRTRERRLESARNWHALSLALEKRDVAAAEACARAVLADVIRFLRTQVIKPMGEKAA
jgi:DNA-binding GntR family transcriptional regulator